MPTLRRPSATYDLNKAAELKYGKLPQLQEGAGQPRRTLPRRARTRQSLLRDKVTEEEIARIVGRWTGIPVSKLMEGEREKLLHLEDVLHQRVIGQDEAVTEGLRGHSAQPCGHSGSEPAHWARSCSWAPRALARPSWPRRWHEALFDDEKNMVRIDMTRVHGEIQRIPSDRRTSGIRGL